MQHYEKERISITYIYTYVYTYTYICMHAIYIYIDIHINACRGRTCFGSNVPVTARPQLLPAMQKQPPPTGFHGPLPWPTETAEAAREVCGPEGPDTKFLGTKAPKAMVIMVLKP